MYVNQQQMHRLLDVPERTLRDWKKGKRDKLYKLLESLDFDAAQNLLQASDDLDLRRLLENEHHYDSLRAFERDLYPVLISGRDTRRWLKLSKDVTLSREARARAAYLYSFLTDKMATLSFKSKVNAGFYYGNKNTNGDGLARLYGLKNGLDMQRFNQYKMTGRF
jgi:hypothetical protein